MFRIAYRKNACNSLEAFLKDRPAVKKDIIATSKLRFKNFEFIFIVYLEASGVCIQSINAVGRVDNRTTGEVQSDYTIRHLFK